MWRLLRRLAFASGIAATVAAVSEWRRARMAGEVPFNQLRVLMNERLNPWLMRRGLTGGRHSEIATIEHIGRRSGQVHLTPVHPTFDDGKVWIPVPYGEASQWAMNVIAAGHCRLQLHETVYELDEPEIVAASEDPLLPRFVARAADWFGVRYLRLHVFAERPGELTPAPEAVVVPQSATAPEPVAEAEPVAEPEPVTA